MDDVQNEPLRRVACVWWLSLLLVALGSIATEADPLSVFDANSIEVGPVIGIDQNLQFPVVAFNADGVRIPLQVTQDRLLGARAGLVFASADCSGTAFADIPQQTAVTPIVPVSIVVANSQLYIAWPATGLFQTIFARSVLATTCSQVPENSIKVTEAAFVADLGALFTSPFSMR